MVSISISGYADIVIAGKMEDIAQVYKALSEQMRLRILMLLTHGELCVCDLMEVLEEPQSKVSRHLAYLKHSGLIEGKRIGAWMHYYLRDPLEKLAAAHLEVLKRELPGQGWAKADAGKLREVQKRKLCDNFAGDRPGSGKRAVTRRREGTANRAGKANP